MPADSDGTPSIPRHNLPDIILRLEKEHENIWIPFRKRTRSLSNLVSIKNFDIYEWWTSFLYHLHLKEKDLVLIKEDKRLLTGLVNNPFLLNASAALGEAERYGTPCK